MCDKEMSYADPNGNEPFNHIAMDFSGAGRRGRVRALGLDNRFGRAASFRAGRRDSSYKRPTQARCVPGGRRETSPHNRPGRLAIIAALPCGAIFLSAPVGTCKASHSE